jgi:hypothetical protein
VSAHRAASAWHVHSGHIALFAAWLVIFAVVFVVDRVRSGKGADRPSRSSRIGRTNPGSLLAAAGSLVAALVHLTVIREHFTESALYGSFFLVLTIAQVAFSLALVVRPTRRLLLAGAAASGLVVVLWAVTRTIGIPLGPAAGETEPVGLADTVASAAEVLVALSALAALRLAPALARPTRITTESSDVRRAA